MGKERITLTDNLITMIIKLSDGNPGAMTALVEILQDGKKTDPDSLFGGIATLLSFDTLGIYGTDIYVLWNDICSRQVNKTIAMLRAHQLGFLSGDVLIEACSKQDYSGRALIDVEAMYKEVCAFLPNFDKENRI